MGAERNIVQNAVFRGKRHDNQIFKVQISLSRNFVVIAQAPIHVFFFFFSVPQRQRRIHRITLMFTIHYLNPRANRSLITPITFPYSLQSREWWPLRFGGPPSRVSTKTLLLKHYPKDPSVLKTLRRSIP